jgi:hypothetical protein
MNTNGLLLRWNIAFWLAEGWIEGTNVKLDALVPEMTTTGQTVDAVTARLLARPIADEDRLMLVRFLADSDDPDTPMTWEMREDRLSGLVGLVMASPYFQWR